MSQSGSAPLARETPSDVLPSPSPSTSDLPDLGETPLNTPKALVASIHEILSVARAGSKKLTIASYAKLFSALDSLDLVLACGDQFEASLKSLKADILAQIATAAPKPPSSYAATVSSPPSPSPASSPCSHPTAVKSASVKSHEVVISMDKADEVLALPNPEIKSRVEAAFASTGHEKLKGVTLRGVRVLSCGRLLLAVDCDKAAILLKQSARHWVPKLAKSGSLVVPQCQIMIDGVSLDFNPASPTARLELAGSNRSTIIDESAIAEIRWINPKVLRDPKKKASSLLVTLTDVLSADLSIARGIAVNSTICYPHRYEEPPLACYNCQHFGHTQHHCPQKTPTCARCAGPHRSSSCPCSTSSTKCGPGKRCDHFSPRCANCQGKHPSYHKDCPVRIKERELQSQRLAGRIFFDPNFDPFSTRDESSSPFFFNSPAPPSSPSTNTSL